MLTLTITHSPATDLGFLLRKHPGRAQAFGMASGTAHVFYPEASGERCSASCAKPGRGPSRTSAAAKGR